MVAWLLLAVDPAWARVTIKPGFNTFTPEQDIELGREAVTEVQKEYTVVTDQQLSEYINRLGQNLARFAPGFKYPYQFRLIQDKDLNAFALPGGPVFVHTAILTAAINEAQLAGVMAHEISHIAIRHSTNQASKKMLAMAPLAILGGVFANGALGQLAQLGISFGLNSTFLKFSRDAERQADEQGAQILYDAGYDPKEMAKFFETLEKTYGKGGSEFFASHPNPGNRQQDISRLTPSLGPAKSYKSDSDEFQLMKKRVAGLPASKPKSPDSKAQRTPEQPSKQLKEFNAQTFRVGYPNNWEVYGEGTSTITLVPPEGIVQADANAAPAVAYGALISIYEPYQEQGRKPNLQAATDQLLRELQRSNPNLRISQKARGVRISGQDALSLMALGDSPLSGESEVDWIVTSYRPDGLWYVVFIAPQSSWNSWQPVFQQMLDSLRFS